MFPLASVRLGSLFNAFWVLESLTDCAGNDEGMENCCPA